jgi:hypothetical protein
VSQSSFDVSQSALVSRPSWLHEMGSPPDPFVRTPNPKHQEWVERCALRLCSDADELGEIPTPCVRHLADARFLADAYQWTTTHQWTTLNVAPEIDSVEHPFMTPDVARPPWTLDELLQIDIPDPHVMAECVLCRMVRAATPLDSREAAEYVANHHDTACNGL